MKKTSSNLRLCVVNKTQYNKKDLIKITKEIDQWKISKKEYVGRSIYILKDKKTIEEFLNLKKYKFKYFEMNENLKKELIEYAQNL